MVLELAYQITMGSTMVLSVILTLKYVINDTYHIR